MARRELHSETLPKIEQRAPLKPNARTHVGDVIVAEKIGNVTYLAELAFMEEPITIRLEPSAEKNAAMCYPVWVNGKGAEVFQRGQWQEIGYLPVGMEMIIKRKVLEVIVRAKIDTVMTHIVDPTGELPNNTVKRFTSGVFNFSILKDDNPRGPAWLSEIRRRNL
jgi:hypothetical protein